METLTLHLMDTEIYIGVQFEEPVSWRPLMTTWFHYVANEWSRFREDNELHALNTLPIGECLQLASPLYECLQLAHHSYEQTNGLFSPYLKRQIEAHGYKRTFAQLDETSERVPNICPAPLQFCGQNTIKKVNDATVDIGGIAKGYAAFYAAKWLQSLSTTSFGIVDVGGDMEMWSHTDKVWSIGIAHPHDEAQTIATLTLQNGGIATSSTVKRSWANGKKHHLLNGQTGQMMTNDKLQITAVAKHAYIAEVAAKTSFFTEKAREHFRHVPRYIVTTNGYYAE